MIKLHGGCICSSWPIHRLRCEKNKTNEGDNVTSATSSNAAVDSKRVMLLIESGVRFHPTT